MCVLRFCVVVPALFCALNECRVLQGVFLLYTVLCASGDRRVTVVLSTFPTIALVAAVAVSVVTSVNGFQAWMDAGTFLSVCFVCEITFHAVKLYL